MVTPGVHGYARLIVCRRPGAILPKNARPISKLLVMFVDDRQCPDVSPASLTKDAPDGPRASCSQTRDGVARHVQGRCCVPLLDQP